MTFCAFVCVWLRAAVFLNIYVIAKPTKRFPLSLTALLSRLPHILGWLQILMFGWREFCRSKKYWGLPAHCCLYLNTFVRLYTSHYILFRIKCVTPWAPVGNDQIHRHLEQNWRKVVDLLNNSPLNLKHWPCNLYFRWVWFPVIHPLHLEYFSIILDFILRERRRVSIIDVVYNLI